MTESILCGVCKELEKERDEAQRLIRLAEHRHSTCSMLAARLLAVEKERDEARERAKVADQEVRYNMADRDVLRALAMSEAGAARLRGALEAIQRGEGPFSNDQLTFASNVIDATKATAAKALSSDSGRDFLDAARGMAGALNVCDPDVSLVALEAWAKVSGGGE